MLIRELYTLIHLEKTNPIQAQIRINAQHPVFTGHFPGMPVLPGVCMIQIIKEVIEEQTNTTLLLTEAVNIKFLSVLNPADNNLITVTIQTKNQDTGGISFSSSIMQHETVIFKCTGRLIHNQ